jgi:membrane fusion protein (multidrug efflux system)
VQQHTSTRVSIVADRVKSLAGRTKILVAAIAFIIALVPTWLILDSVLYERSDDAHIDGNIIPLSARINGYVQQVNVIEGQTVHAGEVLAVLDPKEYSIAVYQASANLAYAANNAASLYYNAAITITTAYGGLNSAQASVKSVRAEIAAAENKLQADEAVLKHVQVDPAQLKLFEAFLAADQQVLVQAQSKLLQAANNLTNAQTAPQQVSLAKVRAQAADSQVLQCKAQLEQAQLNLSNTIIRSPVTGIVGKMRIEGGQNVTVGQEMMDVVSLDDVWITANFKQTQLVRLNPGQPVEIKVDAYRRTWRGHVTNLGGGASSAFNATPPKNEIATHVNVMPRVPVRIDFDRPDSQGFNAEDLLKPGLSVEPKVRVRWLPRPLELNNVSVDRAFLASPRVF